MSVQGAQDQSPASAPPPPELSEETVLGPKGQTIGLVLGPLLLIATFLIPVPAGLTPAGWHVAGLGLFMLTWWVSEAVPIAATALLPLILLPLMGVTKPALAAAPYADPILYLFLGGFILARAIEKWDLHRRFALGVALRMGTNASSLIIGFLLSSTFLSMWISNTATTLMLTPIALGVARAPGFEQNNRHFAGSLVLAIAYGATIGGIGTPVGTPTNGIALAFLRAHDIDISFAQWLGFSLPVMAILLPFTAFILTRKGKTARMNAPKPQTAGETVREAIQAQLSKMGPMRAAQWRVLTIFGLVAAAWMFQPLLKNLPPLRFLSDTHIALIGALSLFVIPAGAAELTSKSDKADAKNAPRALLEWREAEAIPWGIILLFGGGLSLATGMDASGLSPWLGDQMAGLKHWPLPALIAVFVIATILFSEFASNVATLSSALPIVAAAAMALNVPLETLAIPVALAASFGFMLPIATGPNAIAFASGTLPVARMIRLGFWLDLASFAAVMALALILLPLLRGL